ncbi:hypothetical protein HYDPIDRAFT_176394 [Hydnomerulius pinastri MD-312]|uniref:rRNA biogenesis protein RRP36 n=1 Tax=Hydnomerulius pinastri MD-312 TaxID=994086 RepID=A0A0C9W6L9_9AGAM|nr:hypothetical protein HYDPIDRAFT_176394 [Hydnomerulius pinastri MD-312]
MPRRPRPTNRPPPKSKGSTFAQPSNRPQASKPIAKLVKQARPKAVDFLSGSEASDGEEELSASGRESQEISDNDSGAGGRGSGLLGIDEDEDGADSDAPRVAQWVDDEEYDVEVAKENSDESDEEDTVQVAGPSQKLDDLSTLPLGMLRSAQRSLLAQARTLSDPESDSEDQSDEDISDSEENEPSSSLVKGKGRETTDHATKPKKDLAKRANKHAPTEVTSKRPVTRRRTVVEDKTPQPRDPRFLHATGGYDPVKFKQQYNFLSDMHSTELKTLRDNLKRARRLLINSPSHLRAERAEEVQRLELAVKRAESAVNRDTREKVESDALRAVKDAEKEKRLHGKSGWWMKQSEKRELLTKARFDAIASTGGKHAVKKAIEKKQRKIHQKEKKSRPFAKGAASEGGGGWAGGKRSAGTGDAGRGAKRRRVA